MKAIICGAMKVVGEDDSVWLSQIRKLQQQGPLICTGDVFESWNPTPIAICTVLNWLEPFYCRRGCLDGGVVASGYDVLKKVGHILYGIDEIVGPEVLVTHKGSGDSYKVIFNGHELPDAKCSVMLLGHNNLTTHIIIN